MSKTRRKPTRRQGKDTIQVELPLRELLTDQLHEAVIASGFYALEQLLEEERTLACGPRYERVVDRQAWRFGHAPGELVLGGRRVQVERPRARTVDGREVVLPSWKVFSDQDPLTRRAQEQMVIGVSTRKYKRSLESTPKGLKTRGDSKSAVSRRFVAATGKQLLERMNSDISGLELAAIMIDGIHFADHVILVALGVDVDGKKHALGLWEGSTENAAACRGLLKNLVNRGLDTERSILAVIDGGKGLRKALINVFGDYVLIQRCQVHKKRNVREHLPQHLHASVKRTMNQAYSSKDPARAKKQLLNLARRLETEHPGAAASLLEGLDETLTVIGLGLHPELQRILSSTNAIENLFGSVRRISKRVKKWRGGHMILRWVCASIEEAKKGFRRLRGYRTLPKLLAELRRRDEVLQSSLEQQHQVA